MAKRELIEKEYVEDVLSDTINSEGDYRHALRLLNGATITTEQEIVKPYIEKLRAEIEVAYDELEGYEQEALATFASVIDDLIDNILKEIEDRE